VKFSKKDKRRKLISLVHLRDGLSFSMVLNGNLSVSDWFSQRRNLNNIIKKYIKES